ncbi:MAG: DUF924 family protein [Pseudomonadota bacterium]
MSTADTVISFWLDDVGPAGWYKTDEALDREIADRFGDTWRAARSDQLDHWSLRADDALALLILLDQFPRNMFRGCERAFQSDPKALAVAKRAISVGHDLMVPEPERQFFYLPLMHSESIVDQDRCVRLILTRMPKTGEEHLRHARAHREVIRKFGRFPFRNEALGRATTAAEQSYLQQGGYAA